MKIIKYIFLLILIIIYPHSFSQQREASPTSLPNIIPPSPQAANFIRYGEIPVDYSTGVPKIEIPLHTVKVGKLQLPINISYHASGIKVQDIASPVGLGWVLNAGGIISRSILGLDDLMGTVKDVITVDDIQNLINTDIDFARLTLSRLLNNTWQDPLSDRFFFKTPNSSGIFRNDYINEYISEYLPTIPYSPLKIEKIGDYVSTTFKIIDVDGTIYQFYEKDWCYPVDQNTFQDNWNLSKIISADLCDTINFYYNITENCDVWQSIQQLDNGCHYYGVPLQNQMCTCYPVSTCPPNYDPYVYSGPLENILNAAKKITYQTSLLTSIATRNEKVEFEYLADRMDVRDNRLVKIKIYSKQEDNYVEFKEINFNNNEYFGDAEHNNQRLKLKELEITSPSNTASEKYGFEYNIIGGIYSMPEYFHGLDGEDLYFFSEDYWGYFNGANKHFLFPKEYMPIFPEPSADLWSGERNPNPELMKQYVIKKIFYPTGGYTEFEFEANQGGLVYDYSTNHTIGGLRVKTIKNYFATDKDPIIKTYKYGYNEDGFGMSAKIFGALFRHLKDWRYDVNCGALCTYKLYTTHLIIDATSYLPLTLGNQSPVFYNSVTEYTGDETNYAGKKVYIYKDLPTDIYLNEEMDNPIPKFIHHFQWDRGTLQPKIENIFEYRMGSSQPIKVITNTYTSFKIAEFNTGFQIANKLDCSQYDQFSPDVNSYIYSNTKAFTDVELLTSTEETQDGVTKTTQYFYDNEDHLQPTRIVTTNSKAEEITNSLKYPADFSATGNAYEAMISRNILTPVIEKEIKKGTTPLSSIKTEFSTWNSNPDQIYPNSIITTKGAGNPDTRVRYNAYDIRGNILNVSKENDIRYSYYWGYNYAYPVIKAENIYNAALSDLVSASLPSGFENLDDLLYTITNLPNSDWTTFNQNLRNNAPTNVLITTFTYAPLIGITSQTDPNNVVTYYEYDELNRLYVIKNDDNNILQQFGYSYQGQPEKKIPGAFYNIEKFGYFTRNNCETGYTSITPVKYLVPAWKYYSMANQDAADQLAQNDINANGQNYANENGICIPAYVNEPQSATHTKNDCQGGLLGTPVQYLVPEGAYRATTQQAANQLAIDDVNANAQNYANENGWCYNPSLPFAQIALENNHSVPVPEGDNTYFDIVVHFYQDYSFQTPITVNNVNVCIDVLTQRTDNLGNTTETHTTECQTVSGTSAVVIPDILESGWENGEGIQRVFQLLPGDYNKQDF